MKAKHSLLALVCLMVILAVAIGCSKKPNDAQIIGEVTTKIQADSNIQTKTIAVQSTDGVVTLSGEVASDMERTAAANDAAQTSGVRTVVNNLTVATAVAPPPMEEPVVEKPVERKASKPTPARRAVARSTSNSNDYTPPSTPVETAPVASIPAAPPKPVTVTVPDGTQISMRLIDPLDSEKNQVGDRFRGTLAHSITIGDRVAIPAGADIDGRVIDVKGAGHFSGKSALAVELVSLSMGGKSYELHTSEWRKEGAARGKNTAAKVGGGAALGAIIGAIAGGGKGAAIGAGVGAGAGTGVQAVTKGQQIKLPAETVLSFQLASSVTVTPGAVRGRPVLSDRNATPEESE